MKRTAIGFGVFMVLSMMLLSSTASAGILQVPFPKEVHVYKGSWIRYSDFDYIGQCSTGDYCVKYEFHTCVGAANGAVGMAVDFYESSGDYFEGILYEYPWNDVFAHIHDNDTWIRLDSSWGLEIDWEDGDLVAVAKTDWGGYEHVMELYVNYIVCK